MRIQAIELIAAAALLTSACYGQGTISTIAGTPLACSMAEGVPATAACVRPGGIVMDKLGNLYLSDSQQFKIRKINTQGIITTVAGTTSGYSGDGGPATGAKLSLAGGTPGLSGLAIDAAGNLYISDTFNNAIRMIDAATGIITTVAGNGSAGSAGDGGPATKASLMFPSGIAVDSAGNLYIADVLNNRVRKVSAGVISTVAGNGDATYSGDGVQANTTGVVSPHGLTFDNAGNLYISESDRIRKVDTSGIITTIAGKTSPVQTFGFSGDGGPATAALLNGPLGMAVDSSGNLYFADANNERIRKINTGGIISTYAGVPGNVSTPLGNGGPATSAYLGMTRDVVVDAAGNLIIAASPSNDDIRKVTPGLGLAANPGSLVFTFAIGGAAPASSSFSVTSTGAVLNFTAAVSTNSGGNWLSVTPTSGTTPSTLTVSVNPAGLASGTYQGVVTLTPGSPGASPLPFSVTLTVTGAGAPAINSGGIVNATGYQNTLAPDTVFVIFGSGMGPVTLSGASAPNYPTSLNGTSITFTPSSGGAAIAAKMIYSSATQVAGLLPSSITPGTYAVRVTFNGQSSASQNVTVAARSFGIATSNSAGTGAAQATIGNVNGGVSLVRLSSGSLAFGGLTWTLTPAHPGDTLVLWGTGGGADSANDTGGSSGDQTAAGNFSISVGGTQITPLFAGASSGYPGLWQINFTLPATIAPDCFAPVQVSAGGQLSNSVTISIAAAGQTSCSSQIGAATLTKLDSGGNIVLAGLTMGRLTFTQSGVTKTEELAGGVFNRYAAAEFLIPYSGPKFGPCSVLDETYPASGKEPSAPDAQLDAGTLKISGPGLSSTIAVIAGPTGPDYSSSLPAGTLVNGGTYTMTGAGGTQVGSFSASTTMPSSFTVTNLSSLSTINRTQPFTVNWTGTGFDQVIILVQSGTLTPTTTHGVAISCAVPASLGTYSIPAAALAYLPAGTSQNIGQVSVTAGPSAGGIASAESTTSTALTPNLVNGGQVDFGSFSAFISFLVSATIQ
jgi:uncharacterized protein (TIGR03437 family)